MICSYNVERSQFVSAHLEDGLHQPSFDQVFHDGSEHVFKIVRVHMLPQRCECFREPLFSTLLFFFNLVHDKRI